MFSKHATDTKRILYKGSRPMNLKLLMYKNRNTEESFEFYC